MNKALSKETDIIRVRELFKRKVSQHLKGVIANKAERKEYVAKNQNDILNDAYGLLLAEWTRHRWNVLRAANLSLNPDDSKLLEAALKMTEAEYQESQQELERLVGTLVQQLKLIQILDGQSGIKIPIALGRRRTEDDPSAKAQALASSIAKLAGNVYREPSLPNPELIIFNEGKTDNLLEVVQWALPPGQNLLVFADVNNWAKNSYLGVTENSFFITKYGDFKKNGDIGELHDLSSVRYVRVAEGSTGLPTIHIATTDDNYVIDFDGWGKEPENLKKARRLADIFATAMNLPDDEKKHDPIFEVAAQQRQALEV